MKCLECERIRALVHAENELSMAFAADFSRAKAAAAIAGLGLRRVDEDEPEILRVRASGAEFDRLATALAGALTGEELAAARALNLPAGQAPTPRESLWAISLAELVATVKGRWLAEVIEGDRLFSALQPICRRDGALHGHEALLRGRDVDGAIITAGPLLAAAATTRLLYTLDLVARRLAIQAAAALRRPNLKLFVNFDPSSIYDPAYCLRTTASAIAEMGLRPADVTFEVTESAEVRDRHHLRGILAFYRQAGFKVALDDVGAGFSGLNMLRELQPDVIKLDMDLVRGIDADPYRQSIVRHLIGIAHETGTTALAEGVETEAERDWLIGAGIDLLQGYLLGRPFIPG